MQGAQRSHWPTAARKGTLQVAGLWLRLFPTLAQRDALVPGGTAGSPGRP
jgi:hypothetical protein